MKSLFENSAPCPFSPYFIIIESFICDFSILAKKRKAPYLCHLSISQKNVHNPAVPVIDFVDPVCEYRKRPKNPSSLIFKQDFSLSMDLYQRS